MTPQVKDLGIWHYGYGHKRPLLDEQLHVLRATAARIGAIPIPKGKKAAMAGAILYGRWVGGPLPHCQTLPKNEGGYVHGLRRKVQPQAPRPTAAPPGKWQV